ncbi:MAG: sigma-70 family RNA polymerase sigma factor [Deltaproteobacteria bacterium]|nr:sigma-70 family RNA polymerase sigma factor [Deltaproteobacteria bacterium]
MEREQYCSPELQRRQNHDRLSESDEELLLRFEGGDKAAFELIFRRYREPLFRFILRFLRNEHDSQEALQDVFLKVIRAPERFHARSRFSTWLHAVARNLCLDMLRKRKYRRHRSLDEPVGRCARPLVEKLSDGGESPEDKASRGPLRLKLLVAIRALSSEQRQVFLLREVAGMPFAEVAETLDIPVNTAKSRMRYALGHLRRAFEKDPDLPAAPVLLRRSSRISPRRGETTPPADSTAPPCITGT